MTQLPSLVLWDADGVLQHPRSGWRDRLSAMGGAGFDLACFAAEQAPLRGEGDFAEAIAELVAERGLDVDPAEVAGIWRGIDLDPEALELVAEVRASGVRSVLATNQQAYRWTHMRDELGHPDRFDALYVSCELGVTKPDPDYFRAILRAEQVEPGEALFIDDAPHNVESAAGLGLNAVRHDPADGAAGLRRILRDHGLVPVEA